MSEETRTYRVFISAAEPSADSHCADLMAALQKSGYDIDFVGVGGPKMASAGCNLLETTVGRAAMMYNAFSQVIHFYKLVRQITGFFESKKVDLVILCDSPAFNFHVAKAAKKLGIKTLFYVAPQLWAWAPWRITKLQNCCDKLCCVLPFEQDWFGRKGVDAVFVGNPMLEGLEFSLDRNRKRYTDFEPKNLRLALMPGSRAAEINSLWVPMQKIAARLKRKYPNIIITAVAVDEKGKDVLKSMQILGFRCRYTADSVSQAASDADFAIVASGSATLQVAAAGCPMVIMYQSSKILWHLVGRWLVKIKYLSLVNILAERELVPEFMPYFSSIEPIVEAIEKLLKDKNKLTQISTDLVELIRPLADKNASEQVAQIAVEMLEQVQAAAPKNPAESV